MRDINLLPENVKINIKDGKENSKENQDTVVREKTAIEGIRTTSKVKWIVLALAATVIIGGSLAVPKVYTGLLDKTSEALRQTINDPKYSKVRQIDAKLSELNNTLETKKAIINDIDKKSYPMTDVFTATRNACPDGCYITSLECDGSQIRISGFAPDTLLVAEYMSNLDSLEHLNKTQTSETFAVQKANASMKFNFTYGIGGRSK